MKKILLVLASVMSLVLLASCKNDVQDVYITNYDDVSDSYSGTYYGMVTITSADGRIRSSEKIFATLAIANTAKNRDDFTIEFPYEYKFSWAAGGNDTWTSCIGKKSFVKIGNTYYDTVSLDKPFKISGNPYGSSFSFTYLVYQKGLPNITYEEYCNMMYNSDYYKSYYNAYQQYLQNLTYEEYCRVMGYDYNSYTNEYYNYYYTDYQQYLQNQTYEEYCNMMGYNSDSYKAYYHEYQQYLQNLTYEEYCNKMGYSDPDYSESSPWYYEYQQYLQNLTYSEYCSIMGFDCNAYTNDYYNEYQQYLQELTYEKYCDMMGYSSDYYKLYYNDYQQYLQNFTYREYCNMMGYDYNSYNSEYSQTWFSDYQQYLEKNVETIEAEVTVTFKKP